MLNEDALRAPEGKYRVIAFDGYEDDCASFEGDFNHREEAIQRASRKHRTLLTMCVYDDQGTVIFRDTGAPCF